MTLTHDSSVANLADSVFGASSVAIVGASANPTKLITYRPIDYMLRYGFAGAIYPINPNRHEVQGLPAYPSLADTPTTPDVAIVALPRQHVMAALEECASTGTKVAIVYSSGFAEVPDGDGLQQKISDFSSRTGVRVIGPNCQGIANFATAFYPSFSTTFATEKPPAGRTALISQSGAMAGMILNEWTAVGGAVRYWASTGNEADVTVGELALAAIEDAEIDQLLLYLESVRSPEVLAELAERAEQLDKQVVVFRPARTARGWAAAGRHTGAGVMSADHATANIPTSDRMQVVNSIEALVGVGQVARSGKATSVRSLGIISNSGGLGVATTDAAVAAGFTVGDLAAETVSTLGSVLPGFASLENPVDVTAQLLNDPALLATALPTMLRDAVVDAVVVSLGAVGNGYDVDQIVEDIIAAHRTGEKLIAVCWIGSTVDVRARLGAAGVPTFTRVDGAVTALAELLPAPVPPSVVDGPPAPHLDDLVPGVSYWSGPLLVDGDDMAAFAAAAHQTGDEANVHVSQAAARAAGFDRRVVSGLHTLTAITILGESIGLWTNSAVVAGFDGVRFLRPVLEGDELSLTLVVAGSRPLRDGRGIVTFDFALTLTDGAAARGRVDYVFDPRPTGSGDIR